MRPIECSLVLIFRLESVKRPKVQAKDKARRKVSVMEVIGELKLYHIPQTFTKNGDIFMLDLDVEFFAVQ